MFSWPMMTGPPVRSGSLYILTSVPQMPASSTFMRAPSTGISGMGNSCSSVCFGPTLTAALTVSTLVPSSVSAFDDAWAVDRFMIVSTSGDAGGLTASRQAARLVQIGKTARRSAHQEAVALVDHALRIGRRDVRVAHHHIVLAADRHHLGHGVEHFLVLGLARVAEFLAEVALADEHGADAGHILEHV